MENVLTGFNIADMTGQTTVFLSALAPFVTLVLGILLAFLAIRAIFGFFGKKADDDFDDGDFDDDF